MTLQELEQKRQQKGYTYKQVSEMSGLSEEVVIRALKEQEFPGYEVMRVLEKVLCRRDSPDLVREAQPAYAERADGYTLEDYYALPEDRRVELIDGVFYDMAAPDYRHQAVMGHLFHVIYSYIQKKKGRCIVFVSPIDVQLDRDDKTMVQPDIVVLCDRDKLKDGHIVGAPDFLIEILSESTRKKDMTVKLRKYKAAGVREYWMVDREHEKVIVYNWEESDFPAVYDFNHKVPAGIYQGDLEIDFAQIKEKMKYFDS